ncbi:hypothetical protein [Streptomyces violaceusniger]|nr:hypothetical protein [Streptomyces violaceusniger]
MRLHALGDVHAAVQEALRGPDSPLLIAALAAASGVSLCAGADLLLG